MIIARKLGWFLVAFLLSVIFCPRDLLPPAYAQSARDPVPTAPAISAAVLRKHMIPALKTLPKVRAVKVIDEMTLDLEIEGGRTVTVGLANLLDNLNRDPGERERYLTEALGLIISIIDKPSAGHQVTREQFAAALVPVIKNTEYRAAFDATVAQTSGKGAPPLLYRPIAGDVILVVGLDEAKGPQILQSGRGKPFALSDEEMFEQATRNLAQRVTSLRVVAMGPLRMIEFDPNYNASLLAVDAVWASIAPEGEDDLIVAVPARDTLAYTSVKDKEAVEALREFAALPNLPYAITTELLCRKDKGWVVFK